MSDPTGAPSFFTRFGMAFILFWRVLFSSEFARLIRPPYLEWKERKALPAEPPPEQAREKAPAPKPAAPAISPARQQATALALLGMLQREGRLIDFLQEEVAPYPDAEVGAAARIVHAGCRRILQQYLSLAPVMSDPEGTQVTVPHGFDAQRIRLTGNVAGQAPFSGVLKHPGWVATDVRLPIVSEAMDPSVISPAEVEL